jgi:hypothetical protein
MAPSSFPRSGASNEPRAIQLLEGQVGPESEVAELESAFAALGVSHPERSLYEPSVAMAVAEDQ